MTQGTALQDSVNAVLSTEEERTDLSEGRVRFFPPQRGEVLLHGKSGGVVGPPNVE